MSRSTVETPAQGFPIIRCSIFEIAAEQPIETDVILFRKIQKLVSRIALDLGQVLLGYLPLICQPLQPPKLEL
jgi:hypothetical protein